MNQQLSLAGYSKYSQLTSPRFLIVEDDQIAQKILTEFAQNTCAGVECFITTSAKEALRILDTTIVDLVVSDYFLEGYYTGLDLWYSTSSIYPGTEFIITSQMDQSQYLDIVSGIEYPPTFLSKPLKFSTWNKLISTVDLGEKYDRKIK